MGNSAMRRKIVIFLILAAAALIPRLLERRGASSLWTDEFATNWIASASSMSECYRRAAATQGQFPIYFLMEWGVKRVAPDGEWSLRLLSLLASALSAGFVYLTASLLLKGQLYPFSANTAASISDGQVAADSELNWPGFLFLEAPAIFAGTLFVVNVNEIYYALEARPYALATLSSILSLLFFIRALRGGAKTADIAATVFFGVLTCYLHYVFGVALILQNLWVLMSSLAARRDLAAAYSREPLRSSASDEQGADDEYKTATGLPVANGDAHVTSTFVERREFRGLDVFLKKWIIAQFAVAILSLPLAFHLIPILRNTGKWTWLKTAGAADAAAVFAELLDWKFLFAFALFFGWGLMCDGGFAAFKRVADDRRIRFAALWVVLPPISAYFATSLLHSSLLDGRYMLFSLPGLFILMGCLADTVRCPGRRIWLPLFAVGLYLMMVVKPCWDLEGRCCRRVPHDWRSALTVISRQFEPGDAVLLRSGFIKENWVANGKPEPVVSEYVKAPMLSFYFRPDTDSANSADAIVIRNLPYSYEKRFAPYLERILAELAPAERVWIVGVNPPNTNFPIQRAPRLFENREKVFEKNFDGVYVALLKAAAGQERR